MSAEKKQPDWNAIEGEYRAGVESIRAIAEKYGVSDTAIRKQAKSKGWSRDPASTKRQIVKAAMAGGSQQSSQIELRTIHEAAAADVADMERGLRINRLCLVNLETAAQSATEPKEIKVIVEAASSAIESIRRIRGLDDSGGGASNDGTGEEISEAANEIRRALGLAEKG